MARREDEIDKSTAKAESPSDRLDLPIRTKRLFDPRTRRHVLAKIDALLASRRG